MMQTKPTNHGGKRPNAGRKPSPIKKIRRLIQLTPDEWQALKQIHKSASQAVRYLLNKEIQK